MLAMSCGGHSNAPTQPTSPAAPGPAPVTVADVRVGTAGNASPSLSPGQTLQLFAQATSSDGTSADVTNLAVWQSSNPVVATVSPTGLVTAAVEGTLDVTATYSGKSGSLHADVQKPGCAVTLSPESTVFGALTSNATVAVTTTLSTCRWKARSDAPCLSFQFDPNPSGNGSFTYSVPGNNNTIVHADNRAGRLPVADQRHRLRALYAGTNQRHGIGDDPVCGHARVVLLDTRSHD